MEDHGAVAALFDAEGVGGELVGVAPVDGSALVVVPVFGAQLRGGRRVLDFP